MRVSWPKAWVIVRLVLFVLAIAWAGDALLTRASVPDRGADSLILPALALLGFVSLAVHTGRELGGRRRHPDSSSDGSMEPTIE